MKPDNLQELTFYKTHYFEGHRESLDDYSNLGSEVDEDV